MKKRISFWDKLLNKFRIGVLNTETKKVKTIKGEISLKDIETYKIFKNNNPHDNK